MKIELTFPGTPLALQRPRFSKRNGCVYNPQSKEIHILSVLALVQMRQKGLEMLCNAPLQAEVYAYSPTPSISPQKRLKCENTFKATRPDIDNIAKAYLDILNSIAYSDDKLIARLLCEKRYSSQPRVVVIISKLENHD